ncbi:hypothetical protein C900_03545 [Fulvivirga imtechensis AK7]|uniref:Uncharacterized protein n=1 Tax=Fulvivirga imtechensis AK7 TaxID=1237149 RepID=L8JSU0_9BACT|nr:hypothetical protein C900_03545 [Fulvivirga imtechensis AK7]
MAKKIIHHKYIIVLFTTIQKHIINNIKLPYLPKMTHLSLKPIDCTITSSMSSQYINI